MVFIGIDPGKAGAIAILDKQNIIETEVHDMPESAYDLYDILQYVDDADILCIIEKAQSMPNMGHVGRFGYGVGYGKIIAVLEILEIPFQEIASIKWKKEFSLVKKDKKHSCRTAKQLFPNIILQTEKGRWLDGRAEALLMAEYGRRLYNK